MGPLSVELLLWKLGKPFTFVSLAIILALSALIQWSRPVRVHLNRIGLEPNESSQA